MVEVCKWPPTLGRTAGPYPFRLPHHRVPDSLPPQKRICRLPPQIPMDAVYLLLTVLLRAGRFGLVKGIVNPLSPNFGTESAGPVHVSLPCDAKLMPHSSGKQFLEDLKDVLPA